MDQDQHKILGAMDHDQISRGCGSLKTLKNALTAAKDDVGRELSISVI
ncbi:MAG: hypothetical protein LBP22_03750 [Deltaproteobacteria bacterium]|nr:hypothetical protein [Deltaproteobacteria bacterium]